MATKASDGQGPDAQGSAAADQIGAMTYEEAREELITVVARLESGQLPLADSMALWRRGEALAAQCTALLDAAQEQLDGATEQADAPASGPAGSDGSAGRRDPA